MDTIDPTSPPTLDQLLNSGNFIEVNVNKLVPNEVVILRYRDRITCVQIMNNTNDPNGRIKYRFSHDPKNISDQLKPRMSNEIQFYRRDPRQNFDKAARMIENRIHNNTIGNVSDAMKNVMGNPDLYNLIGNNLGPGRYGKGGRRKTRRSRKTRKNKRKSTRRTGRKYKK